ADVRKTAQLVAELGADPPDEGEPVQALRKLGGDLRVPGEELIPARPHACPLGGQVVLDGPGQARIRGRRGPAVRGPGGGGDAGGGPAPRGSPRCRCSGPSGGRRRGGRAAPGSGGSAPRGSRPAVVRGPRPGGAPAPAGGPAGWGCWSGPRDPAPGP